MYSCFNLRTGCAQPVHETSQASRLVLFCFPTIYHKVFGSGANVASLVVFRRPSRGPRMSLRRELRTEGREFEQLLIDNLLLVPLHLFDVPCGKLSSVSENEIRHMSWIDNRFEPTVDADE